MRTVKRTTTSLKDLLDELKGNGRHSMLSFSSSLPISVLFVLETEANRFSDRNHPLYNAALLTRCYTQHALRFIDSETKRTMHFIKVPFINEEIDVLAYIVSLRIAPSLHPCLLISKILNRPLSK